MKTEWIFYNFPIPYSLEEYEEAKRVYIENVSRYPCVEAIYQLGNISVPGISDMDFIFVINPRAILPGMAVSLSRLHRTLGGREKYLICHEPMGILTEDLFSNINWLLPSAEFKKVTGKTPDIRFPAEPDRAMLKLLVLTDYARAFWPWEFLRYATDKRIDARMTLLRLNSFKHSICMYNELVKEETFGLDFCGRLDKLRIDWFDAPREKSTEILKGLIEHSVELGWMMIEKLSELITRQKMIASDADSQISAEFENVRRHYFFADRWSAAEAGKIFSFGRAKFGLQIHLLPASFVWPLVQYARAEGLLSRRIRSNLHICNEKRMVYHETAQRRAAIMNEHLGFICAYGWLNGIFTANDFGMFDEGYLHPSGKKWLHILKTVCCRHIRRPFFRYANRRVFKLAVNNSAAES